MAFPFRFKANIWGLVQVEDFTPATWQTFDAAQILEA
jgi:hypothetical protein